MDHLVLDDSVILQIGSVEGSVKFGDSVKKKNAPLVNWTLRGVQEQVRGFHPLTIHLRRTVFSTLSGRRENQ